METKPPSVSQRVVEEVADATNRSVMDLPPLYNSIDPDGLNGVFHADTDGRIQFEYCGHTVIVYSGGDITVRSDE